MPDWCNHSNIPIFYFKGQLQEYCQWESFHASCPSGEVIDIESAHYGRMQLGRCLTTDYYIGCSADVLLQVQQRCSGKQNCVIDIPDPELFSLQPCRKDLQAYFAASYSCVKGIIFIDFLIGHLSVLSRPF